MKKKSLSAKKTIHKSLLNHLNNSKVKKVFNGFKNYLDKFIKKKDKIGVAISGGPDSLALAFLAKCYFLTNKLEAKFFIVDHKIRKESSKEAKLVRLSLKKFNINCEILKWHGKKPHSNIQGIARNKRYALLKNACKKNDIKHLLIGHHIDDLYENFFIRLLRGSGLKGLSSFGEAIKEEEKLVCNIIELDSNFDSGLCIYLTKKPDQHVDFKYEGFVVKADPAHQLILCEFNGASNKDEAHSKAYSSIQKVFVEMLYSSSQFNVEVLSL